MPLMFRIRSVAWRMLVPACVLAVALSGGVFAQESPDKTPPAPEKPAPEQPPKQDTDDAKVGHDRPTSYPRIQIGGGTGAEVRNPAGDTRKLTTRAYLLDVSAAMAETMQLGQGERATKVTRLSHMVSTMERALDTLAKRRDVQFNLVSFGSVADLAGGAEPLAVTPEAIQKARDWLAKLEAKGTPDVYTLLKEVYEQAPESASMLVGSMPGKPAGVSDEVLAKHASHAEYVLACVQEWRAAGKATTLDITGIGLDESAREFYKKLAAAAGGTYLDG